MLGQNGKLGHSCTKGRKGKFYNSRVSDLATVHLGLNVSSYAHNCGCVVEGSGATLLRKPIATVSLHRQRTSRRQRASHLHRLVNGDVYGLRILIATPTSLSHVRATR